MDNGMDDWMDGNEESSEDDVRTTKKCVLRLFLSGCYLLI